MLPVRPGMHWVHRIQSHGASFTTSTTASHLPSESTAGLSPWGQAFFGTLCAGTFGFGVWQTQRFWNKVQIVERRQSRIQNPPIDLYSSHQFANSMHIQQAHSRNNHPVVASEHETSTLAADTSSNDLLVPYQRYRLYGRFIHTCEVLVGPRGPPPGALNNASGSSNAPQGTGYMVLTPLLVLPPPSTASDTKGQPRDNTPFAVVWVNRGWVPRQNVAGVSHSRPSSRASPEPTRNDWVRPEGLVQVTVVPGVMEGRYIACIALLY
jgi:surfeit locus 1 family protein